MMPARPSLVQFWDHYQNGLCWPACREFFNPLTLISLFCFPYLTLLKTSPALRCRDVDKSPPSFQVTGTWINHLPFHQHLPHEFGFYAAGSWPLVLVAVEDGSILRQAFLFTGRRWGNSHLCLSFSCFSSLWYKIILFGGDVWGWLREGAGLNVWVEKIWSSHYWVLECKLTWEKLAGLLCSMKSWTIWKYLWLYNDADLGSLFQLLGAGSRKQTVDSILSNTIPPQVFRKDRGQRTLGQSKNVSKIMNSMNVNCNWNIKLKIMNHKIHAGKGVEKINQVKDWEKVEGT